MASPERPGRGTTRGLPPFFYFALATGVLFVALLAWQSVRAFRESVYVRDDGWVVAAVGAEWRVATVRPDGPAAGLLTRNDVIVAVDGDTRAGRIGPAWLLRGLPAGRQYELRVRRDGNERTIQLEARHRYDPAYAPWLTVYLIVALTTLGVGLMIAVVRPEDRAVQLAFMAELFAAGFMLWLALRSVNAIRQDWVVLALGLSFPLNYVFTYLFFERFPREFAATRRWQRVRRLVVLAGVSLWAVRAVLTLLWALPVDARVAAVDRAHATVVFLQTAGPLGDLLYVVAVLVAMFGVLRRNFVLLPEGSDRRRISVIVWGQLATFVPGFIAAAAGAVVSIAAAPPAVVGTVDLGKRIANAMAIVAPLSFGYAIVKHRVLGFRLAVRIGIQYVLAKNALRTAVLLPVLWLVYTVAAHPDRTIGQLLFSGAAWLNLAVLVLAALGLQFRTQVTSALDRRFFRAAYDQEAILHRLVDSVTRADSAAEIAAMASREIDAALHVARVLVFYNDVRAGNFEVGFSTQSIPARVPLSAESLLIKEIGRLPQARTAEELVARATPREAAWLDELQIELVVPMRGIDQNLVGLLMVGEKRSEEPFTSQDRRLLQIVAAQIASVYEVLTLREQVGRQHEIHADVLASLDERHINLVKECPTCGRCYDRADERCAADGAELTFSLPVDRTVDGKYRLERLLGRGGMGAVYEALDLRLDRRVAIKVIKGSALHGTAARRRFAREAQACARLTHPNIVRVYDYGAPEGQAAYLVMEHVQGKSWRAELDRVGTFTPAETAALLAQVFDGMQAAHDAGVLHRDLKPDNLVIAATSAGGPQVKILDFGLAKVRESSFVDPKSQTVAGVAMGTFGYMSPEQLAAESVDERTDVYSLGVVALETLTGPLPAFGPNFHPVIEAEVERRLIRAAVTPEQGAVAAAIDRALAPNRNGRFASIRAMREALIPALLACEAMPGVAPADRADAGARLSPAHATTQSASEAGTRQDPADGNGTHLRP